MFLFLKSNLFIGNQIIPKIANNTAIIIPKVEAIIPSPKPGPKYALELVIEKKVIIQTVEISFNILDLMLFLR